MDDKTIIALFWAREEEAIRQTEQHYGSRLQALSNNILRSVEDAQECVSDTYLKAWNTIPPSRPQYFFAYLAAICRNLSLNKLDWKAAAKRKAEVVTLTEEMALCIPDEAWERQRSRKELGDLLNRFLDDLSKESRLIFLRRYWYLDTVAQIARRYSITESKVKMQLSRTREKLRLFLQKEGISV